VHAALPQLLPVPLCSHAPPPLHLPVLPHGGLAGHPPRGSGIPDGTFAHEPANPVTEHDWQFGHDEVLQQTPSTHESPVRHSAAPAQAWPRRFLSPHRLVLGSQMAGARQSASTVQAALHAEVPLQRYGAQVSVLAARHTPKPSQVRTCVSVDELAGHDADMQAVPTAYTRQLPWPLQAPSVPQLAAP
jgi:hypothetical protein